MKGDYALIGRSLEDIIIEPMRSKLIPGFEEVKLKCKTSSGCLHKKRSRRRFLRLGYEKSKVLTDIEFLFKVYKTAILSLLSDPVDNQALISKYL